MAYSQHNGEYSHSEKYQPAPAEVQDQSFDTSMTCSATVPRYTTPDTSYTFSDTYGSADNASVISGDYSYGQGAPTAYSHSIYSSTGSENTSYTASVSGYQPPTGVGIRLPCDFVGWGHCDRGFSTDNAEGWIEHIISHLGGSFPPKAMCWFCDKTFDSRKSTSPRQNFRSRMYHIYDHIVGEGKGEDSIRPDYHYADHLRDIGLISDQTHHMVRRGPRDIVQYPGGSKHAPRLKSIHSSSYVPDTRRLQQERDSQLIVDEPKERRHRHRHHHKTR